MTHGAVKLAVGVVALATALAFAATLSDQGGEPLEHPQGVSLREESTAGRGLFFVAYATRGHRGGGPLSGK